MSYGNDHLFRVINKIEDIILQISEGAHRERCQRDGHLYRPYGTSHQKCHWCGILMELPKPVSKPRTPGKKKQG